MIILLSHWLNKIHALVVNTGILIVTIPWLVIVWFVFLPFALLLVLAAKLSPNTQEDTE
jgi:hypothetical protein